MLLNNLLLHRYWFRVNAHFGFGVTAYSREDAEAILAETGLLDLPGIAIEEVIEDVDLQTLSEVCKRQSSIGPPNFRGVWCPFLNLHMPYK